MPIRVTTPADRPAIAALWAACFPFLLVSPESLTAREEAPARHALSLVHEENGAIVGSGVTWRDVETAAADAHLVTVLVAPEERGRGIGTALADWLTSHQTAAGARKVTTRVAGDEGFAFAEQRGFRATRTERISRLDLGGKPPAIPPLAEGLTARLLSEVDDLRAVHDLESAVAADIPADVPVVPSPYEEWLIEIIGDPRLDPAASIVVYDGDVAVALTETERIGERVWSGLTGTRPSHRGLGLAKYCKAAGLARAKENGATVAFTSNDASNAPMLAVNTALGYLPFAVQRAMVREL